MGHTLVGPIGHISRYCEIFTALEILQCASSGGV